MPDGWFHTGDVGRLDADGCLFVCGRRKDVISVMGMKFFPQEVEAVSSRTRRWSRPASLHAATGAAANCPMGGSSAAGANRYPLEGELRDWCGQHLAAYEGAGDSNHRECLEKKQYVFFMFIYWSQLHACGHRDNWSCIRSTELLSDRCRSSG